MSDPSDNKAASNTNRDTASDRNKDPDELTYAAAGVDIEASEAATAALIDAVGESAGDYAGLIDIGDRYLALATDGVGTKLLVAAAIDDYSTIGIDCVAMNVNDLVAAGVQPVAFVDYLAIDDPDENLTEQIGVGLDVGADIAGITLIGGETAILPEVVDGFDLAGTCAGLTPKNELFQQTAQPGDALVGFASSGIHSNGLTLARTAITREHEYTTSCPFGEYETLGAALLEPTQIYTDLLDPMRAHDVRTAAHITGGGLRNIERLGSHRYTIDNPLQIHPIFEFVQSAGSISDEEMYRTFNMGIGLVCAMSVENAEMLTETTDGEIIGQVETGDGVTIRGIEL
ncbi:phosphoribosylformylglycinamidine cyclo-ligase [Haloquadratum walsbyi]|jgi:phosphoribosylformylglycinamidine cyclo-ligase (EC 6.3.3.1)|uniref:phosphoribosylformylglycinamidine cyclo-ligase n=1 Tax=Haloquadratum walsbyi J07HQW2 TaxID=1238425 RepID=U1PRB9_9EURY|nr:phosphoribosylformylglycinamidine cyclo-ligase [Haloquadratum walsbyi]ERG94861.1 MAG: phosphoribosylaminoimidazole synthetase [Haloquadratum walsbyi J07HQW2]